MNVYKATVHYLISSNHVTTIYVLGANMREALHTLSRHITKEYSGSPGYEVSQLVLEVSDVVTPKDVDYNAEQKDEITKQSTPLEELGRDVDLTE